MNQYGLWGSHSLETVILNQPGVGMLSAGCLHSQEDPLPPLPSLSCPAPAPFSPLSSMPPRSLYHASPQPQPGLPLAPSWQVDGERKAAFPTSL